jgi:sugar/nucleoside kinase (ribokinase family)
MTIVFNPAPRMEKIVEAYPFDLVDVLILNRREALDVYFQLTGDENEEIADEILIQGLFSKCAGLKVFVCTLGEHGSIFVFPT